MFEWVERRRQKRMLKKAAFDMVEWSRYARLHGVLGVYAVLSVMETQDDQTAFAFAYADANRG